MTGGGAAAREGSANDWFARARWREPAAVIAFFVVLVGAMFLPLFTPHHFFEWDVPDEYWGDLVYLCHSLRDGRFPTWNPFDRFGYPFIGDPQNGLFNPLDYGVCLVTRGEPSLFAASLRVPLYFVLGGCGMHGFLRALKLPFGAALVGATAFVLAPFQRAMWEVNPSYTISLLPFVLWSIEKLAQSPSARGAALVALSAAFVTVSGSPPGLFFATMTAVAFALVRLATMDAKERPHALQWLIVAALLAIALTAVKLWPAREMSRLSVQQGTDFARISAGGYPLRDAIGIVWPRNKYLYLGVPVVALAFVGAFAQKSPLSRSMRIAFGLLAVFAFVMAFGAHTPVFRVAFTVVPGVSAFREPVRYSAVLGTCMAVLAAAGASLLPRARIAIPIALGAVIGVAWFALPAHRDLHDGDPPGARAAWDRARARMNGYSLASRVHDEFGVGLRGGTRFGFRDARGYQDPLSSERYSRVINSVAHTPGLLAQFNVRWVLRGPHFLHGVSHHFLPAGEEAQIADDRGDGVWEVRDALPFAYWVARADRFSDGEELFARIREIAPRRVAFLEMRDGIAIAARSIVDERPASRDAVLESYEAERVVMRVDAPQDGGWLVVNEAWWPGWRAEVDGREVEVERANFVMRAVPVPRGVHQVVMRFAPRSAVGLRWLAVVALMGCCGMVFARRRT